LHLVPLRPLNQRIRSKPLKIASKDLGYLSSSLTTETFYETHLGLSTSPHPCTWIRAFIRRYVTLLFDTRKLEAQYYRHRIYHLRKYKQMIVQNQSESICRPPPTPPFRLLRAVIRSAQSVALARGLQNARSGRKELHTSLCKSSRSHARLEDLNAFLGQAVRNDERLRHRLSTRIQSPLIAFCHPRQALIFFHL